MNEALLVGATSALILLGALEALRRKKDVPARPAEQRGADHSLTEIESTFESLRESIIVLDADDRIVRINRAACAVSEYGATAAVGKSVEETFRSSGLLQLVRAARSSPDPVEGEVTFYREREIVMRVYAQKLRNSAASDKLLVVLNDITEVRRLEMMRTDFIANVSHELKTPIASIQGAIETLLDGASEDPEAARRFLEVIDRHARRLGLIFEDLLALSRLEDNGEHAAGDYPAERVRAVLDAAIEQLREKLDERGIEVNVTCEPDLTARLNARLIEQALVNLMKNACTYSASGGTVEVRAARTPEGVELSVRDHGCGIEAVHLDRIFERFYRTDHARSRDKGGTGIGLAIVKHIALAHGGSVGVTSTMGQGSTFSLTIPARPTRGA